MQNHREKSPVGIVAISAITTALILGALTYFFFQYGLAMLSISTEPLYTVLLRLLPIIIGLILVLIALAIRPPVIPKDTDSDDELEKDAYTSPLYNLPQEDESHTAARAQLPVTPRYKESPVEQQTQKTDKLIDSYPAVTPFMGVTPISPRREEVVPPMAYPEEIEEPFEAEIVSPGETTRHTLGRAVLFGEYPFPIDSESQIAQLLAPIEETIEDGDLTAQDLLVIEDTFETRLENELTSANELGYDLSLAVIELPKNDQDLHSVDATIVQNLFNRLGVVSFFYLTEEHRVSAILPFHGFEQSRRYFASLLESLRKQHPETAIKVGYSSSRNREVSAETVMDEALIAVNLATERSGYSLIGYDTDLEVEEED